MSLLIAVVALVLVIMCWHTSQEVANHVIALECKVDDLMKIKVKPAPRQYQATIKGRKPPMLVDAQSEAEALRRLLNQGIEARHIIKLEVMP